ncbi:alpha-L-arabinofuranosidase C-terminal domain-containing protein [uncultured Pseudokineococcus sp.]|uniref:alpha-L-arabinofuranosidase C-terminal domain-containing protein n=1 Tax=uncultured Pseudokineococcus sp. TaxID=1642928 RepID=UPI0026176537|nr:alpha-L-arabinofuranosidase C-terminal domain-containing protein [uncultured Pseudokineococcus sp.]
MTSHDLPAPRPARPSGAGRTGGRTRATAVAALLLGGVLLPLPASTAAPVEPAEYDISLTGGADGPEISDSMYGIFYEDINWAADGGLYAELVRNRSFEFSPEDNAAYGPLTGYREVRTGGSRGTVQVVDDDQRLNERNRTYLQLDLGEGRGQTGVRNEGFTEGMPVVKGERYTFSVWARTDAAGGTPLTVTLRSASGLTALSKPLHLQVTGDGWAKYTGEVRARSTTNDARLQVLAGGGGTVRLDMVSLMPQDTFKGRQNGLRKDLAEKIAALEPGFLRFPGGCLVNTGSMEGYDEASGYERQRSYQWKDTVGPVEERATNANFWGYNQTYGLGYFEYFQFAEDLGAMPLPVVPALVTGCGQNRATDDPELLARHIQDTLDLIEFANGDASTEWGGLRAEMGHPEPFGLTHIGVGNEENLADAYFANFLAFREAIEAAHPEIVVVGNSGPDDEGRNFDRLWQLNRDAGTEMVDEHYYNSPSWFLQNNERYDAYDREGPDVFLGEYASQGQQWRNALAEASFMTGLERNADVVKLASYAPLLASEGHDQWFPNLIWFDDDSVWGTPSYENQKLFMTNVGDRVVPSTASSSEVVTRPVRGAVGLSTWLTSAAYDDVRVTSADGEVLLDDDFADGAGAWSVLGGTGAWSVQDGEYVQSSLTSEGGLVSAGDESWTDYDLELTARKTAGAEGFLVAFGVQGTGDYYWWNLGGFGNTRSLVEKAEGGGKSTVFEGDTVRTIEAGRDYDLKVSVRGRTVTMYVDGQEWGSFTDDAVAEPFRHVTTYDEETGDVILKVVNAQDVPARADIDLGDGFDWGRTSTVTTLTGDPGAEHSSDSSPIGPEERLLGIRGDRLTYDFEPSSVTFLRIATRP